MSKVEFFKNSRSWMCDTSIRPSVCTLLSNITEGMHGNIISNKIITKPESVNEMKGRALHHYFIRSKLTVDNLHSGHHGNLIKIFSSVKCL